MDPLYLNQLPTRTEGSDYDLRPHLEVLHDLFTGNIHTPEAAAKLASAALSLDASLEAQLGQLWHLIFKIAYNSPEHQDKLVSILADMSHLPDIMTPGIMDRMSRYFSTICEYGEICRCWAGRSDGIGMSVFRRQVPTQ